jgi:hypothetical protein
MLQKVAMMSDCTEVCVSHAERVQRAMLWCLVVMYACAKKVLKVHLSYQLCSTAWALPSLCVVSEMVQLFLAGVTQNS